MTVLTTYPLNALAKEIREVNARNEWPTPGSLTERELVLIKLGLASTEIAEAIEVCRVGPLNFAHLGEELADVKIRLLDLAAGLGLDLDQFPQTITALELLKEVDSGWIVANLTRLIAVVARLIDQTESQTPDPTLFAYYISYICHWLDCYGYRLGVDVPREVRAKLEKNKTRGVRHGNKVLFLTPLSDL